MRWGVCVESIPVQSTRSTRNTPFVQQSHPVNMGSLFIKLVGNHNDYVQPKFVILFASGASRTSHYDLLQANKGSKFVFTAKELPRIARKYWRITKPVEDQSSQHPCMWNVEDEFTHKESPPSPPDSPPWRSLGPPVSQLQNDPLLAQLSLVSTKRISFPAVTRELMKWKGVFNEVFKNMDRVVFTNQFKPITVVAFSYALETHFQRPTAAETFLHIDQGICELMKGIWVCWESQTYDSIRKKTGKKASKVYQDEIEAFVLSECMRFLNEVRDSLMFFIHMITSNISHYNRKPESIELVLHYLGFFSSPVWTRVGIYRWMYGNNGHADLGLCSITHDVAHGQYQSAFLFILERVKKCRNSSSHSSAPSQKGNAAELLLALAMLSGISNMNPQSFSDLKYDKIRWYG